jgi:DNA-binding IscR family transcriptional regulator
MKKLEGGGLVAIKRGSDGGVTLIADLAETNLLQVVNIMEDRRWISACLRPEYHCARREVCDGKCRAHDGLLEIQGMLDEKMRSCNLKDLLLDEEPAESVPK